MNGTYFITGIDTNIGKSYATGYLAKQLADNGTNVITQKMIQTGNVGYSEDIHLHRKIMEIDYTDSDRAGLTAPVIFSYPCSPHLAAKLDGKSVNKEVITNATRELEKLYDVVLLEGAGGLMVPISDSELTIDYMEEMNYPVILVTSGKLGSLNHTLLSLEAIKSRNLKLHSIIYNLSPKSDPIITADSLDLIKIYLSKYFPEAQLYELPHIEA